MIAPACGVLAQRRHEVGALRACAHAACAARRRRRRRRSPRCRASTRREAGRQQRRWPDEDRVRADERAAPARATARHASARRRRRSRRAGPRAGRTPRASCSRSSSACVGCWCLPSPALTTCAAVSSATKCAAPASGCRSTITSGSYADRVSAVSFSDSPLSTDEPDGLEGHRVGGEPLRRELERRARARRRLVEDVQDEAAAQRRQLLVLALLRERERPGGREQTVDVVADRSAIERRCRRSLRGGSRSPPIRRRSLMRSTPSRAGASRTRSTSSISSSSTWTRSPRIVGRFLPT